MSEYIEREPWALRCRKCGWTGNEHHLRPGNYPGLSERGCPNCGAREHNMTRRFQLTIDELTDRLLRTAAASEVQMAKDLLTEAAVNLRALRDRTERVEPPSDWVAVGERLPERDDWYLVQKPNGMMAVAWFRQGEFSSHWTATHWQPLPEPFAPEPGEG